MIVEIEALLDAGQVARFRRLLSTADWQDGRATAGYQSALAKDNLQLAHADPVATELRSEVLEALKLNLVFQTAALPAAIFPPLFSLYRPGQSFGAHVDNAFRPLPDGSGNLRTDVSATLFLSDPDSYAGGELLIEEGTAERSVKLAAGSLVIYPATTLHRVAPVTRGERLACFFWVQSYVPEVARRSILLDIDLAIQSLRPKVGDQEGALITLTGAYHNLLRLWGQS
jgi:PKHD-type hydroxylase